MQTHIRRLTWKENAPKCSKALSPENTWQRSHFNHRDMHHLKDMLTPIKSPNTHPQPLLSCSNFHSKHDKNAKPDRGSGFRYVERLHELGLSAEEAQWQATGGPWGPQEKRSSRGRRRGSKQPHSDLSPGGVQQLHGHVIGQQPVGRQQQWDRIWCWLLPLLQAERGVPPCVPVTHAEIGRFESRLPDPPELHLPHLWSHRRRCAHTPLLPGGAAPRRAQVGEVLVVQQLKDDKRFIFPKDCYHLGRSNNFRDVFMDMCVFTDGYKSVYFKSPFVR